MRARATPGAGAPLSLAREGCVGVHAYAEVIEIRLEDHAPGGPARGWTSIPIVVLSARQHGEDKVEVLDLGADVP